MQYTVKAIKKQNHKNEKKLAFYLLYCCFSLADMKVETPLLIQMKVLWKKLVKVQYQALQKTCRFSICTSHISEKKITYRVDRASAAKTVDLDSIPGRANQKV